MDQNEAALLAARTVTERALAKRDTETIRVPATIAAYGGPAGPVVVTVDGDTATINAENLTGHYLAAGQRVMLEYVPPRGIFVTGIITPSAGPIVADTVTGAYYRIEVASGAVVATAL